QSWSWPRHMLYGTPPAPTLSACPLPIPEPIPLMADLFSKQAKSQKQAKAAKPQAKAPSSRGAYTAKDIEVLEGLEPVRRRPGMYIGGTDETAMHHLIAEALDNAMDEAVAGHASTIEVALEP